MYDSKTGLFSYGDTEAGKIGLLQLESAYYLRFNSKKALYAIERIKENYEGTVEEKCFYYHVYLDLLFEAVGLIYNRFTSTNKNTKADVKRLQTMNCQQYGFDQTNYPLLSQKAFRNFIEHIDERDERLAENKNLFGAFNLIYSGMDQNTYSNLTSTDKPQNNLLNLVNMTYSILEISNGVLKTRVISINDLESELKSIYRISSLIWMHLSKRS